MFQESIVKNVLKWGNGSSDENAFGYKAKNQPTPRCARAKPQTLVIKRELWSLKVIIKSYRLFLISRQWNSNTFKMLRENHCWPKNLYSCKLPSKILQKHFWYQTTNTVYPPQTPTISHLRNLEGKARNKGNNNQRRY